MNSSLPSTGTAQALESLPWLEALADPATYPHATGKIEILHTHLSVVALTGTYAYKLKKPVQYGFADFSTLELRRKYCEAELRLNRRTAPELYLGVVPLIRSPDGWRFGGGGTPAEYAVRMRQFDPEQRLDRVASRGILDEQLLDELAQRVARLHQTAQVADAASAAQYPLRLAEAIAGNFQALPATPAAVHLRAAFDGALAAQAALLKRRAESGCIRECHGDLHLANICLWHGHPLLFDCIEFNANLRVINVLSDTAFLYMDLLERKHPVGALRLLNGYLERTGEYGGLPAWPLWVAYRAHVRAKIAHLTARAPGVPASEGGVQDALRDQYLQMASGALAARTGGLVMLAGLPGSGKSTQALKIACAENGIRVRSDVERKRLQARDPARDLYGEALGAETYRTLLEHARAILAGGFTAVLDATYHRQAQRQAVLELARELRVPLRIVHCDLPLELLRSRVRARQRAGGDVSDADEAVLLKMAEQWEPFGEEEQALTSRLFSAQEREAF